MNRIIFFSVFTFVCFKVHISIGQTVLFNQNFNNTPNGSIPLGWAQFNGDSLTVLSFINNLYGFGYKGWIVNNETSSNTVGPKTDGDKYAVSTSAYTPNGYSNDWLITPPINLGSHSILTYNAASSINMSLDDYEVRLTTTGAAPNVNTFNNLLATNMNEPHSWTMHSINLSAFANTPSRLAFRNFGTQGWALFVDDITVTNLNDSLDVKPIATNLSNFYNSNTNSPIHVTIQNNGYQNINSLYIHYQLNNNPVVSESFTNQAIQPLLTKTIQLSNPINFNTVGTQQLKIWTSLPNGFIDNKSANDTILINFYVAAQLPNRKVLLEGFSNTSCIPCKGMNQMMDSIYQNRKSKMAQIKYHTGFPSNLDPMYTFNTIDNNAKGQYYLVGSVPRIAVGGNKVISDGHKYTAYPTSLYEHVIDSLYQQPSPFKIELESYIDGDTLRIHTKVISMVEWKFDHIKTFVVVLQDSIHVSEFVPSFTAYNNEAEFKNIMRKILPNKNGNALNSNQSPGLINEFNDAYKIPNELPKDRIQLVVVVQDSVTREILQVQNVENVFPLHTNNLAIEKVTLYPNPVGHYFSISGIKVKADIQINDVLGNAVLSKHQINNHEKIELPKLPNGLYYIVIKQNEEQEVIKMLHQE
jgi:hypothetical protein